MSKAKRIAYVKLAGSEKTAPHGTDTHDLDGEQSMEVTVRIKRKQSIEGHLEAGKRYSREEYARQFGASDEDIDKIEEFAQEHQLTVVSAAKAKRSVLLKGKVKDFEAAFKVKLSCYKSDEGYTYRGREGKISIPANLKDIVEGVFGLDDRPHLRPMFQIAGRGGGNIVAHRTVKGFNPNELARLYGFPADATGKGQCIAIIELGGGYRTKDLTKYFSNVGVHKPVIRAVSVDGAKNDPSTADGADGEVMLDIEVAGAVAPHTKIVVYFAPNTDMGFLNAVTTALHDEHHKPSVISISWGAAEKYWTKQSLKSYNETFKAASLLGVTVCCAAGDAGSGDNVNDGKVHADFPASSPYVLACGGTTLKIIKNKISSETVWHNADNSATGGGVSDYFPLPDYQKKAKIPASVSTRFKGRGLPDVAANADPNTGYNVRVDGEGLVIGGTSAVAPLMAGLIALVNEKRKTDAGFINPALYAHPALCRDITEGDNITAGNKGYKAKKGWDACTGWGVLSGL